MDIPNGTSVQWFASNDGGETWEAMTIDDTQPIDEDWTEYTLVRTFSDPQGNKVRYKAELTGTVLTYPRIHTLGATLSCWRPRYDRQTPWRDDGIHPVSTGKTGRTGPGSFLQFDRKPAPQVEPIGGARIAAR